MKCALIIPSWIPGEIFPSKTASSQINYWQPLGILYVGACLLNAKHEVKLFDGAFVCHEKLISNVKEFAPQFAGIYATAFGWGKAVKTAEAIKNLDKDIFTCVGGPYPIAAQERCLNDNGHAIDAAVTGEGEFTLVEMLKRLQAGESLLGLEGVAFRQNARVIRNPPRALITDLDIVPFPARELLTDAYRYIPPPATYRRKPVAVLTTSRGCDRRCIFCFQMDKHRKSGVRGIRYRSVANVLEEIELCITQGYREIKFIDESFTADYGRATRIVHEIKARRLDFTWFASACVNQVDEMLLSAMRDAGCWAILFGVESGVQKNLNTLRKGTTLAQIRTTVQVAKNVGLQVSTPFMFGIPGETFEDGLKTIEFALELAPDLANFHALTPFPGTYLFDHAAQYGTISRDLEKFTYQDAAFVPYTMTREDIFTLREMAFRRFYSRPSFLLKRLLSIRTFNDCKVAARGLATLLRLWLDGKLFHGLKGKVATRSG